MPLQAHLRNLNRVRMAPVAFSQPALRAAGSLVCSERSISQVQAMEPEEKNWRVASLATAALAYAWKRTCLD